MILWLTGTHGRYKCLQRNLRCYLDQDYQDDSVMFVCNTGIPLKLPDGVELPSNKKVFIDNAGAMNFTSVGQKFEHAIKLAMRLFPGVTIVTHADDDDIFLPNHLSAGMSGIKQAFNNGQLAYKPYYSYYRQKTENGITVDKVNNTLEPSIFVDANYLLITGYAPISIKYHQRWLVPLVNDDKVFVDKNGASTLVYNWGDNGEENGWCIYKMSGSTDDNYKNFTNHRHHSVDMGNGILTPAVDNTDYYAFKI